MPASSPLRPRRSFAYRSRPDGSWATRWSDSAALRSDHFSECVMKDTEPLTPGEEGLRDLVIMMAIYDSARSGQPVKLTP